ncbi:MAG TPA: hypothetical protein VK335_30030 [Bryobacteraceae bacterium]|nr:hypothetical protein [Bryobacteraceae bacterium]
MSILGKKPKADIAGSQSEHLISVTSSSGNGASGPTVGLEIRLPEMGVLTLDMRREEAYDLANELLAAVAKAQRKHEQQFGRVWNSTF